MLRRNFSLDSHVGWNMCRHLYQMGISLCSPKILLFRYNKLISKSIVTYEVMNAKRVTHADVTLPQAILAYSGARVS